MFLLLNLTKSCIIYTFHNLNPLPNKNRKNLFTNIEGRIRTKASNVSFCKYCAHYFTKLLQFCLFAMF